MISSLALAENEDMTYDLNYQQPVIDDSMRQFRSYFLLFIDTVSTSYTRFENS